MDKLEDIWLMESDCCDRCGAILDFWEATLCADCWENACYAQEQERYDAFDWWED